MLYYVIVSVITLPNLTLFYQLVTSCYQLPIVTNYNSSANEHKFTLYFEQMSQFITENIASILLCIHKLSSINLR